MARAALFDVDGTLTDTNHLHVVAWWEAFRQAGHTVAMRDIHRAIGLGSADLVAHCLGEDRDSGGDEDISAAHSALYGTYFNRLAALDGARDLLYALHERGRRIVLATSAGGFELDALRRAIDADDVIAGVASADDVASGKPAPDPVLHALDIAGCDADDALFVGDSVWDMKAATKAGVRAVALLSGGIPRDDLEAAGATAVYADPADMLAHLDGEVLAGEE
ncbi:MULTISPECIES: HAD family hydrolase [unclassified Streptomyces]|uniref:HAD family hydrolase n=1 Tax=unclassified Streptomyces TaxID=2593676 RepID=UPI0007462ACB|nr:MULTISPECIES: HAD family hydrolase [unclassified Streptomyces]KUL52959.1 HAD family hydrolase [Streptomyces sp. NRRL S-1521]THC51900.1 HAD family hydrolase [Streptomyces sp. A1499]